MAVDLKNHPGLNPAYFAQMERRQGIIAYNRHPGTIARLRVPPQPNKYIPHIGAKQRAKGAAKC